MSRPGFSAPFVFLCLLLHSLPRLSAPLPSPYLSANTFFTNYQRMLKSLRIFTYTPAPHAALAFTSPTEALFFSLLQNSTFQTHDPEEAHLFFIPLPFSALSTRLTALAVSDLRHRFPYWNRTLGADHFFVSCSGLARGTDRNALELKKNALLVSCFPSPPGDSFIPHKDIALFPFLEHRPSRDDSPVLRSGGAHLAYTRVGWVRDATLLKSLCGDADILTELEPLDGEAYEERVAGSKFCIFEYPSGDVWVIGEAVRLGCVPLVITGRPIQDLPLVEVVRWDEMAVFVRSRGSGTQEEVKGVMRRAIESRRYEDMKGVLERARKHLEWNREPEPFDAFHMAMYQLSLRRHTIRYAHIE